MKKSFLKIKRSAAQIGCIAILLASSHAAWAEDKGADRNARRVQLMQQQMQEQQAQWDSEKAALNKKFGDQEQELGRLQSEQKKSGDASKRLESQRAEMSKAIADLQSQLAEQKHAAEEANAKSERELTQQVHETKTREQERVKWQGNSEELQKQLSQCSDKNQRLVKLGAELLTRYKNKNIADIALQKEPLLQFGDIELFNQVQDYRDKLDAERYEAGVAATHRE